VDEVLVEGIAFDESQGVDAIEPLAEERRQTTVELDRGDLGAGVEEASGQETEAGADLEDPPAWPRFRLGQDRVEDVGIGEKVLRQGVPGA
jgi:hypothetical protein